MIQVAIPLSVHVQRRSRAIPTRNTCIFFMLEYGDLSFLAKEVAVSILKIALCQKPLAKK